MSAFIVSDDTMARVLEGFWRHGKYLRNVPTTGAMLSALWSLNAAAVNARYGEEAADLMPDKFGIVDRDPLATDVEIYKALHCFIYQCSEGDMPGRDLYRLCQDLQAEVAAAIIAKMPSYNRAAWDGPRQPYKAAS